MQSNRLLYRSACKIALAFLFVFLLGYKAFLVVSISYAADLAPVPAHKPHFSFESSPLDMQKAASLIHKSRKPVRAQEVTTKIIAVVPPSPKEKPIVNTSFIPTENKKLADETLIHSANAHTINATNITNATNATSSFSLSVANDSNAIYPKKRPWVTQGPLSKHDSQIYKNIFSYQAIGQMSRAEKEFAQLRDYRLRGHVLYQKYMHPTSYRSQYDELKNWMELYADLPGASKIYKLALARMPKDAKGPLRKPQSFSGMGWAAGQHIKKPKQYMSPNSAKRSASQKKKISTLKKRIAKDIRNNAPTRALKRLDENPDARLLDFVEVDQLKGQIAVGYYHAGKIEKALLVASQSVGRSTLHVPLSGWIAGLSAWRLGHYLSAADYFEVAGHSPYSSGWMSAAASYWAARANMKNGNVKSVSQWLKRAADHPHTFYGLIAAKASGVRTNFKWGLPTFTKAYHDEITAHEQGLRAMALVAAGQVHLAEAELMRINAENNKELRKALLAYAGYAGLPGLQMRLANTIAKKDGVIYDSALYPLGPWKPKNGFKVDPSLLNAIMRQESRFYQMAESRSGAMGLMQLMPKTAIYLAGNKSKYKDEQARLEFLEPDINLELGQKYLLQLMRSSNVQGEILPLLIAYNAGPGNLHKFKNSLSDIEDPLLFIESIPLPETRAYIERVISSYWVYRLREGLPTPTLTALAEGKPAKYAVFKDNSSFSLAAN